MVYKGITVIVLESPTFSWINWETNSRKSSTTPLKLNAIHTDGFLSPFTLHFFIYYNNCFAKIVMIRIELLLVQLLSHSSKLFFYDHPYFGINKKKIYH